MEGYLSMYNFTVIIPHKNIPGLLQRCLDSIPLRDDLQIVIVDDNSDASIVDFNNFPGVNRPNTEIFFSKGEKGKGPGFARNMGMSKARGKWVIFSDADDYFNNCFNEALHLYLNVEEEVVFFKCTRQDEFNQIHNEYPLINDAIDKARETKNMDSIVYGVPCPVAKFIKRSFLEQNNIRYQEIVGGDDILFSIRIAVNLKLFILSDMHLYCVVDRPGSLTRNNNWKGFYSYVKACLAAYPLMKPVNKEKLVVNWTSSWWGFLWAENKLIGISLVPEIFLTMGLRNATRCLRQGMKRGSWNWRKN
ncbi:MAG: glycosyltransferase family A protein [Mangrovibacterium sp.]